MPVHGRWSRLPTRISVTTVPRKQSSGGCMNAIRSSIERNLAMELVRITELGALNGARWMGRGDKNAADDAAVRGMRSALQTVDMDGIVVIGEGEKDEAPML